jgi:hypothetical protein
MKWIKQGLLFCPSDTSPAWMASHAALPIPFLIGPDRFRVFLSIRNAKNQGQIGYVDIEFKDRWRVIVEAPHPSLSPGALGAHDDAGVTGGCVFPAGGTLYLYYTGWSLGRSVPFYYHVGIARSLDQGQTFERLSPGPLIGTSFDDPFLLASPSVMKDNGRHRMWYISGCGWRESGGEPEHRYHVRYREGAGPLEWSNPPSTAVTFETDREFAFGRPWVLRGEKQYHMWYCVRGDRYRIGYAISDDGLVWHRRDGDVGIDLSDSGWDSESQSYPAVFRHGNSHYMLYNGNGYGKTGVGIAMLEGSLE